MKIKNLNDTEKDTKDVEEHIRWDTAEIEMKEEWLEKAFDVKKLIKTPWGNIGDKFKEELENVIKEGRK